MKSDRSHPPSLLDNITSEYNEFFPEGSRDEAEFRLARILSLAARRWGTYVEHRMLEATGQSRSRWQALFVLSVAKPPVTTSDLSARLAIQWPPLVRTLNALEADGLITRTVNPDNKRSRFIEITPAGLEIVKMAHPKLRENHASIFSFLSEDEIAQSIDVLERVFLRATKAQASIATKP